MTRIEIMQMPVEKLCLETGNVLERFETAEVPEEKDNVDEMMMQFRGREEELVETLRSMQERQVAQKWSEVRSIWMFELWRILYNVHENSFE